MTSLAMNHKRETSMPLATMIKINELPWKKKRFKPDKVLEEWPKSRPIKNRSEIEEEISKIWETSDTAAANFDAKLRSHPSFKKW